MNQPDAILCHASMNYAHPGTLEGTTAVDVTIFDGRRCAPGAWEDCGFELMHHHSALEHFDDDDAIAATHYDEMAALAAGLTGCDHALISSHIQRNPEQAAKHADLGPIEYVHSDFAASYGDRLRAHYRSADAGANRALERAGLTADAVSDAKRLLVLQFWRNVGAPKMDRPIAFCDARTVPERDVVALPVVNYADGGFDFDTLGVLAPPDAGRHRWYAFAQMQHDEVVAFRTYDSERVATGAPYWTPHSAYRDPDVTPGAPSRHSIEVRATCLFG